MDEDRQRQQAREQDEQSTQRRAAILGVQYLDTRDIEDTLAAHKAALNDYQIWDEKVKHLLRGRRHSDLAEQEMHAYREAATERDAAYARMRQLERALLDNIPGASTGEYPKPTFDKPPDSTD